MRGGVHLPSAGGKNQTRCAGLVRGKPADDAPQLEQLCGRAAGRALAGAPAGEHCGLRPVPHGRVQPLRKRQRPAAGGAPLGKRPPAAEGDPGGVGLLHALWAAPRAGAFPDGKKVFEGRADSDCGKPAIISNIYADTKKRLPGESLFYGGCSEEP